MKDKYYQQLAKRVGAKVVPGWYVPEFNLLAYNFDSEWDKSQSETRQCFWQLVLSTVFQSGNFADYRDSLFSGNRILVNDMQANPGGDFARKVNEIKGAVSPRLNSLIKTIQEADAWNTHHSDEIFAAANTVAAQLRGDFSSYRSQESFPPYYQNSFSTWHDTDVDYSVENLKTVLINFFQDYTDPSYSLSFFKKLSRHYIPEAENLISQINSLDVGGEDPITDLTGLLKKHRLQLMEQMIEEGRPFQDSHLLRRLDFALVQLQELQQNLSAEAKETEEYRL